MYVQLYHKTPPMPRAADRSELKQRTRYLPRSPRCYSLDYGDVFQQQLLFYFTLLIHQNMLSRIHTIILMTNKYF